MLIIILIGGVTFVVAAVWIIVSKFNGEDHSRYDLPKHKPIGTRTYESPEHATLVANILADRENTPKLNRKEQLHLMRTKMDERGEAFAIQADVRSVLVNGMLAEWVIAPNVLSGRRLLYIHGGAYMVGSSKSHRRITSRLSEVSKAAVLAIDYRLLPEHNRMDGIIDCRTAYEWIFTNGPDGQGDAKVVIIAGDSSGGNLVLSTIAWARDEGLPAADAVVVISPQTDLTLSSPSLVKNVETDVMQGASFGPIVKAPRAIALGFSALMHKSNPSNPIVSPLLGNLSNLPPMLIQTSMAEMFLDDAVRYVNKANASGSSAALQTWPFMVHVWHAFEIPEAEEAFAEIEKFLMEQT